MELTMLLSIGRIMTIHIWAVHTNLPGIMALPVYMALEQNRTGMFIITK